jgi:hypothetical protein
MTISQVEELKERASHHLKRVTEIASGATKTALISLAALTIIWYTQIQKQHHQLLDDVYPALRLEEYEEIINTPEDLIFRQKELNNLPRATGQAAYEATTGSVLQDANESGKIDGIGGNGNMQGQPRGAESRNLTAVEGSPAEPHRSNGDGASAAKLISVARARVDKLSREGPLNIKEFVDMIKGVSFEVFGFKLPVPPLYAALVWNSLLFVLLMYLAQARSTVWALCADALFTLKKLGRKSGTLEDIAGSGPLWLAPPPSRPGKADAVTTSDLRSAFGWNRLETLPSIAATAGFLLLCIMQLVVSYQGYELIAAARDFTNELRPGVASSQPTPKRTSSKLSPAVASGQPTPNQASPKVLDARALKQKIAERAEKISKAAGSYRAGSGPPDLYELKQKMLDLTVTPSEASLLSGFLFLSVAATLLLVVRWFRPWNIPGRLVGESMSPQRLAGLILFLAAVVSTWLFIEWYRPGSGLLLGTQMWVLPAVARFIAASGLAFCLLELIDLALFRKSVPEGIAK